MEALRFALHALGGEAAETDGNFRDQILSFDAHEVGFLQLAVCLLRRGLRVFDKRILDNHKRQPDHGFNTSAQRRSPRQESAPRTTQITQAQTP